MCCCCFFYIFWYLTLDSNLFLGHASITTFNTCRRVQQRSSCWRKVKNIVDRQLEVDISAVQCYFMVNLGFSNCFRLSTTEEVEYRNNYRVCYICKLMMILICALTLEGHRSCVLEATFNKRFGCFGFGILYVLFLLWLIFNFGF